MCLLFHSIFFISIIIYYLECFQVSDDYRKLISGNIDDCFRIGVAIAKKSLKLYTAFDESDILIASPLGLRMIVGESGENNSERETDFLASIEVLIIDKVDLFFDKVWNRHTCQFYKALLFFQFSMDREELYNILVRVFIIIKISHATEIPKVECKY